MFIVYIFILIFILLLSYNFVLGNNVVEGLKGLKLPKKLSSLMGGSKKKSSENLESKVDQLTADMKELNEKVDNMLESQTPDEISPDIMTGVIEKFSLF